MTRPCAHCPFLREGAIELQPGRLDGIVAGLLADDHEGFICHEVAYAPRPRRVQCAGAMVMLLKAGQPSVLMRLGAVYGLVDFEALRDQADDVIDPPCSAPKGEGPTLG